MQDRRFSAPALRDGDVVSIFADERWWRLTILDPMAGVGEGTVGSGRLTAPMPGRVAAIAVRTGDKVARGATLMSIEAMKMEHAIVAPADGVVGTIHHQVGDLVEDGAELIRLEAAEG